MKKGNLLIDIVGLKNIYGFIRKKSIDKNNVYQNYIMGNLFTEKRLNKNKKSNSYNLYVSDKLVFK